MNLARYRAQLDRCCRRTPRPTPRPKTGIEKEREEQAEAARFWHELEKLKERNDA